MLIYTDAHTYTSAHTHRLHTHTMGSLLMLEILSKWKTTFCRFFLGRGGLFVVSSSHPCCSTPKEGQSPCLKSSTFAGGAWRFVGRACPSTALGSPPAVLFKAETSSFLHFCAVPQASRHCCQGSPLSIWFSWTPPPPHHKAVGLTVTGSTVVR